METKLSKDSPDPLSNVIAAVHVARPRLEVKALPPRALEILPGGLALASLDRLALAAFILNRAGRVHYLNAAARALLDERCVRVWDSGLRFAKPLGTAFDDALRMATQSPWRSSLLPFAPRTKEVWELSISPLEPGDGSRSPNALPLALIFIARPQPDARRIVQRVRALYGLTEAEARVMAGLALGGTVESIAGENGVRASTVRAQVRSIFDKTGVNRQSDLVRLALTGAPLVAERNQ